MKPQILALVLLASLVFIGCVGEAKLFAPLFPVSPCARNITLPHNGETVLISRISKCESGVPYLRMNGSDSTGAVTYAHSESCSHGYGGTNTQTCFNGSEGSYCYLQTESGCMAGEINSSSIFTCTSPQCPAEWSDKLATHPG